MKVPENLKDFIRREDRLLILSHINPEGDALGSSIALALSLQGAGKEVQVYNRDGVPGIYSFLPKAEIVSTSIDDSSLSATPAIILDCNSLERVGLDGKPIPFSAVVDHHETENSFGDIRWIEPHAPATGLMVYYLIRELGYPITPEIATNLYTAIAIDTGTFRYENTTADTFRAAADLVEHGARPGFVSIKLYESWSRERFSLLRRMLQTLEIIDLTGEDPSRKITIAITCITREMFSQTGTTSADTENFSNFPRMISDVDISAMFRETGDGKWKASLRSKGDVNVAVVASSLGGGGHRNAAGFLMEGTFGVARDAFIHTVKEKLL